MADMIRVNTDLLERCAGELRQAAHGFGDAAAILAGLNTGEEWWTKMGRFNALSLQDEGSSVQMGDAGAAVRSLATVLRRYDGRLTRLGDSASRAASMFDNLENNLSGKANGQDAGEDPGSSPSGGASGTWYNSVAEDGLAIAMGYPKDRSRWSKEMKEKYDKSLKEGKLRFDDAGRVLFTTGTMTILADGKGNYSVTDSTWREKTTKRFFADGSYREDKDELKIGSTPWKDKIDRNDIFRDKSNSLNDPNYKGPKRDHTIFEIGAESSVTKSAFHAESKYEDKYFNSSSSVDLHKVNATAKIQGGLYSTKVDENGNTIHVLEPGIAAEIGVSYSLFEATHKGRVGTDDYGVSYGGTVKGPSASAKVDAELGYVNGHVSAHAKASAEVIAGEVSGEVGVDYHGVGVKAKGSLNYGIGAHAEIGAHDGKISCDIGLSIGVGGSVKVELDYGKAVDRVVKKAQEAYHGVTNTIKAVKSIGRSLFHW